MNRRDLEIMVSDAIFTTLSHKVRERVDENGNITMSESTLLSGNYRLLSHMEKLWIEELTLDIINAMEHYLGEVQTYANRYRLLPIALKEFLEADPGDAFLLGQRLMEAANSRLILERIRRLADNSCTPCSGCEDCFLIETLKILSED